MPREAFELITNPPAPDDIPDVVVMFGSDSTLRNWAQHALTDRSDAEILSGDQATWRDIRDEVSTVSLFDSGHRRVVIVRNADELLKDHRGDIEKYLSKPSSVGRLVLEFQTLASNTRIYKLADASQLLVNCNVPSSGKNPDKGKLRKFLCDFVAPRHQCKLLAGAADTLIDLIGFDVGMLDTEIAKLACYEKPGGKITEDHIHEIVGGWRASTIWQTIDAVATGNAAEALRQLDRMMSSGQPPVALLPQMAWSMRRFGLATAAVEYAEQTRGKASLGSCLEEAGFRNFEIKKVEQQMRQLGRARGRKILSWLLDADLKLKGSHSSPGPDRWVLEEFVLKLAKSQ